MKALMELDTEELVSSGIRPGLPPSQPTMWRNGSNVFFEDGGVRKFLGFNPQGTETASVSAFVQAFVQGERRVYVLSQNKVRKWTDGAFTDLTPGGLSTSIRWSAISWGTWLIATNNVDPPWIWKNTGTMVPLGGLTGILTRARLVKKLRNMVIFFGSSLDEQTATWSNVSAPEQYAPAEGNFAGQLPLRDIDSDIVAAHPLAGDMVIYTSDSMVRMGYVGLPNVWGFDPALPGIGAVSDAAVVPVQRMHYGMGRDGFWQTDGVTYEYLGRPEISKWWADNLDRTRLTATTGFHYKALNTVIWTIPTKDGGFKNLGYDYVRKSWTMGDQQITAGGDEQAYQWPVVALGASWGFYDVANAADPFGTITSSLESGWMDAGKAQQSKRWDMVRMEFTEAVGQLEFSWAVADTPQSTPPWSAWEGMNYENWIGREGVYFAFRFRGTQGAGTFILGSFSVHGEVTSYRT